MTRLPLAILLAAVLGLSACSDDSGKGQPEKVASRDAVNPCTLAFTDQPVATTLGPGDIHGSHSAKGTYGRDCDKAPNGENGS